MSEVQTMQQTAAQVATEGKRARRVLMPRMFATQEWITQNVVAKDPEYYRTTGKRFEVQVGRVYGVCTGAEKTSKQFNDKVIDGVKIMGMFEGEIFETGEIINATVAYLPMAYAEQIYAIFASQPDTAPQLLSVQLDCDIGVAATGKAI